MCVRMQHFSTFFVPGHALSREFFHCLHARRKVPQHGIGNGIKEIVRKYGRGAPNEIFLEISKAVRSLSVLFRRAAASIYMSTCMLAAAFIRCSSVLLFR